MTSRSLALCVACLLLYTLAALADDWPQWRGPNRDGTSKETGLLKEWPKGGPKQAWKATKLGDGQSYSTPSVARGRIYLMSNRDNAEFVVALEEKTGKPLWSTRAGGIGKNTGPQYPG